MTKQEFLSALEKELSPLSRRERRDRLAFYGEIIADRIEEGCSEEEVIRDIGTPDEVGSQIRTEAKRSERSCAIARLIARTEQRSERGAGLPREKISALLVILGSPIWASLLVAAAAVLFSVYISLWAVVISVWAVCASLAAVGVASVFLGVFLAVPFGLAPGAAILAAGNISAGLAIFLFFGCTWLTRQTARLGVISARWFLSKKASQREEQI